MRFQAMPAHAMQCTIIVHVAKITKFIYRHNFTAEISEAKCLSYSSVEKSISGASVTLPARSNVVPELK